MTTKPVRAALLPEDDGGDPVIIELPAGDLEQLKELQRRVGGNVETVRLPIGDLWINEEPYLSTNRPNSLATTFVKSLSPNTLMSEGRITCPAVLTGIADEMGEITDLKGFHHTPRETK